MRHEDLNIHYVCGSPELLGECINAIPFSPFTGEIIDFVASFSDCLRNDLESKKYPDVLALAFWCRKAALRQMKDTCRDAENRLGRGMVFHIAPSSIPLHFAYSLIAGLLAGNANVVKISSREYPQAKLVINHLIELLRHDFHYLKRYIVICSYDYILYPEANDFLSLQADARLIWGGDKTIAAIEKFPLKPGSVSFSFASRFSICIIETGSYLREKNKEKIAGRFFTDAYTFDQKACSSPYVVIWLGEAEAEKAQTLFWGELQKIVKQKYEITTAKVLKKFDSQLSLAATIPSERVSTYDNTIFRIRLHELANGLPEYNCGHGFFLEYTCNNLNKTLTLFNNKKLQTVSYFGIEKESLMQFITGNRVTGVSRLVPIGCCLDFSLVWDGTDLIGFLSKIITC